MLDGDPGFVDAAREDFRLKPDSPAWKLGFKPVPFDQIGLEGRVPPVPAVAAADHRAGRAALPRRNAGATAAAARSPDAVVRYTLDGSEPTAASPQFNGSLTLKQTTMVRAAAFPPPGSPGEVRLRRGHLHRGASLAEGLYLSDLPAVDVQAHAGMKRDTDYQGGKLEARVARRTRRGCCSARRRPGWRRGQATWLLAAACARPGDSPPRSASRT